MKLHLPTMLRKALLACFAAVTSVTFSSGSAWAAATDLVADTTHWTLSNGGGGGSSRNPEWKDGAIYQPSGWNRGIATYTDDTTYTVGTAASAEETSFSVTWSVGSVATNATDNVQSIALVGTTQTLVLGHATYNSSSIYAGLTENTTATVYVGTDGNWGGTAAANITLPSTMTAFSAGGTDVAVAANTTYTVKGALLNDGDGTYTLNLTLLTNGASYTVNGLDVGSTFDITKVVFACDGAETTLSSIVLYDEAQKDSSYQITLAAGETVVSDADWTVSGESVSYTELDTTSGDGVMKITGAAEGSTAVFEGEVNVESIEVKAGDVTLKGDSSISAATLTVGGAATATLASDMTVGAVASAGGLEIGADATLTLTGNNLTFIATTTGTGTIELTEGGQLLDNTVSEFAGVLDVAAGKQLDYGTNQGNPVTAGDATVRLNDGSVLYVTAFGATLGVLDVQGDAKLQAYDSDGSSSPALSIGEVKIAAGKTLGTQTNWEGMMLFGKLNAEGAFNSSFNGSSPVIIQAIEKSGNITNGNSNGVMTLGVAGANSVLNIGGTITNNGTLILADAGVSFSVCDIADFQGQIEYDTSALWNFSTDAVSTTGNGFATKSGTMQIIDNNGTLKVGADGEALTDLSSITVVYRGVETTLTADGKLAGGTSSVTTGEYVVGGTGANATVAMSTINAEAAAGDVEWKKIILKEGTTLAVDENMTLSVDLFECAAGAKINVNTPVTVTAGGAGTGTYSANYIANMTGTGTLLVNHDTLIGRAGGNEGIASDFAGTIQVVSGGFLTLGGSNQGYQVDLSEATIELAGGNVNFSAGSGQLKKVHVTENGNFSITEVKDVVNGAGSMGTVHVGEFCVEAGKTGKIAWVNNGSAYWLGGLNVGALTGEGDFEMHHGYWATREYAINAVGTATQSFGDITIARSPGGYQAAARINLSLGADENSVLNFANFSNTDGIVNMQGVLVGQSVISGNGTFNFVGDVTVTGDIKMNSTFTQTAGKTLTVDGGALTLGAATTVDTLSVTNGGVVNANAALTINNLELSADSALGIDLGKVTTGVTPITASTYGDTLNLMLGSLAAGEYALFQGASTLTLDKVTLLDALTGQELTNAGRAQVQATMEDGTGLVKVTVALSGSLDDLVWETADTDNVWSSGGGTNWTSTSAGADQQFYNGDSVAFAGAGEEITLIGTVQPASITVSGTDYVFAGAGSISGSATITLEENASLTISTRNTSFTGSTTLGEGSTLTITNAKALGSYNAMEHGTVLGKLSGAGTLVINLDNASDIAVVKGGDGVGNLESFNGDVVIQRGKLYVGDREDYASGNDTAFNVGKITICDGGQLWTHFAYGTNGRKEGIKELTADIDLQSGAVLGNKDGQMKYSGDIRFNVLADGSGYNASGSVVLTQYWAKDFEYAGQMQGDGTVQFTHPSAENNATYRITGENNTFAGTYELIDYSGNTSANKNINLRLASATAAQYADVKLSSTHAKSYLLLDSDTTINGLYGVVDAENAVQAQDGNRTLTVTEGDFGALVMDSGSNVLSLTKQGAADTTLILRGANTYTGATTVNGGTLELAGTASLGSTAVTVNDGAGLKVDAGATMSATEILLNGNGRLTLENGTYSSAIKGSGHIYKMDAAKGSVSLTGIGAEFTGTIHLSKGTLNLGDAYELSGTRVLDMEYAVGSDLKLTSALTLGNGKLSIDAENTSDDGAATALNLNNGTLTLAGGTSLTISGWDSETFTLFSGVTSLVDSNGDALVLGDTNNDASLYFDGVGTGSILSLTSDGKLQLIHSSYLIWGEGTGTWVTNGDFTAEDEDFTTDADVKFGALTGDSDTVAISGGVDAGKMLIEAGEGKTYLFSAADDASGIVAADSITINSGTASFGAGTLDMTADTALTVNDGATLSLATGAIADASKVALVLNDGATFQWESGNTTDYSASLDVADGASVSLVNNSGSTITLAGAAQSEGESATYDLSGNFILASDTVLSGTVGIAAGNSVQLQGTQDTDADNYNQTFTGDGSLVIAGGQNIHLTGTNSYKGSTQLGDGGRLFIDTASALSADTVLTGGGNVALCDTMTVAGAHTMTGEMAIGWSDVTGKTVTLTGSVAGAVKVYAGNTLDLGTTGVVNGAAGIDNAGTLVLHQAVDTKVTGSGTVQVDGTGITWDNTNKTYTGTTALLANATVTTASSLTSGENSKITLADGSQLTITGGLDSWTTGHTVSGTGTLVLDVNGTASNVLEKLVASGSSLSKLVIEDGTTLSEAMGTGDGAANVAVINAVSEMEVKTGATLDLSGDLSKGRTATSTIKLSGGALKLGTASQTWISTGLNLQADSTVTFGNNAVSLEGTNGDNATKVAGNGHALSLVSQRTEAQVIDMAVDQVTALTMDGSFTVKRALSNVQSLAVQSGTVQLDTGTFNATENKLDVTDSITVSAGATLSMKPSTKRHADIDDGGTVGDPTSIGAALTMGDGSTLKRDEGVISLDGGLNLSGTVTMATNWAKGMEINCLVAGDDSATMKLTRSSTHATQDLLILKQDNIATGAQTGAFTGTWDVAGNFCLRADATNALAGATVKLSDAAATLKLNTETVNLKALTGVADSDLAGSGTLVITNTATSGVEYAGIIGDGVNVKLAGGYQKLSGAAQTGTHVYTNAGGVLDMTGYTRSDAATGTDTIYALGGQVNGLNLGAGMSLADALADGSAAATGAVTLGGNTVLGAGSLAFRVTDSTNMIPGTQNPYKLTDTLYQVGSDAADSISLVGNGTQTLLNLSITNAQTEILDPTEETAGAGYRDHLLISGMTVSGLTFDATTGLADASDYFITNLDGVDTGSTAYNLYFVQNSTDATLVDLVLRSVGSADTLFWNKAEGGTWVAGDQTPDSWVKGQMQDGTLVPSATTADFEQLDYVVFGDLTDASGAAVSDVTISVADDGVSIGNMTVQADTTNYTIGGGAIGSTAGNTGATLTKLGAAKLILTGANSYTGDTTISGGSIVAQHESALSNTTVHVDGTTLVLDYAAAAGGDGVLDATVQLDSYTGRGLSTLQSLSDAEINAKIVGSRAKQLQVAAGKKLTVNLVQDAVVGTLQVNEATGMTGAVLMDLAANKTHAHTGGVYVFQGELALSGATTTQWNSSGSLNVQGDATLRVQGGMTLQATYLEGAKNTYGAVVLEDASKLKLTSGDTRTINNAITSEGATLNATGTNSVLTLTSLTLKGTDTNAAADTTLTGGTWVLNTGAVTWDAAATGALALGQGTTVKVNDDTLKTVKVDASNAVLTTAKDAGAASALNVGTITVGNGGKVQDVDLTITGTGSKIQGSVAGVKVAQTGTVDLTGTPALTFASAAAGNALRASLASLEITSGRVLVPALTNPVLVNSGSVTINGAQAALDLSGANKLTKADGTTAVDITINDGSILGAHTYNGLITVDDKGTALADGITLKNLSNNAKVLVKALTGTDTAMTTLKDMQGVTLADGSTLTLSSQLEEGKGNLMFDFVDNATGTLKLADGATLTIDVNGVLGDVLDAAAGSVTYTLADADATGLATGTVFDAALKLYNIQAEFTADGHLILSQTETPLSGDAIYRSSEDNVGDGQWAGNGADVYTSSEPYASIYIDRDTEINLTEATPTTDQEADGLVLSNLIGRGNGANLTIVGDGDDLVTINNNLDPADVDANVKALSFNGDIDVTGTTLQIKNTVATPGAPDAGELDADSVYLMNGALTTDADSMVEVTAGILKLNGKGSNASELLGGVTIENELGQLQVGGEASLGGTLQVSDEFGGTDVVDDVELLSGSKLTLLDGATLESGFDIGGTGAGTETLSIAKDATVTINGLSNVEETMLELNEGSTLNVSDLAYVDVDGLSGTGALGSTAGNTDRPVVLITPMKDSTYSGDLSNYDGTIEVASGGTATQTFDQLTTAAAGSSKVDMVLGGSSIINVATQDGNKTLNLQNLELSASSDTTLEMNTDAGTAALSVSDTATMLRGASLTLSSAAGDVLGADDDLLLIEGGSNAQLDGLDGMRITLDITDSAFHRLNEIAKLSVENGKVYVDLAASETNRYEEAVSDPIAKAGAEMLWDIDPSKLPDDSALKAVDSAVASLLQSGNRDAAERALAATAGAGTAVLGSAFSADVERQLRAIRNRTTTMGVNQCEVNEGMPYVNAWINAEGDHREMDADGLTAGYTMDSWGGTVGFDVDITNNLTMGMAVTAMYGDLQADSADRAEGDFDTQYVSLFARVAHQAWVHTFVATLGRADVTLNRTVSVPGGSFETSGDTDGMAYGFMYEVARTFSLSEDGSTCWQPVFNVTWRHSSVDGYTESGADTALAVGSQDMNVLTFGAGARLQTVIGESLYNRASIFEARALVKVDAGDRESEAGVALLEGTKSASVKSAELGAVGVEIGAGVTIPVGMNAGSIFIDGSAEFRSGYSNVNGTVGYRINF